MTRTYKHKPETMHDLAKSRVGRGFMKDDSQPISTGLLTEAHGKTSPRAVICVFNKAKEENDNSADGHKPAAKLYSFQNRQARICVRTVFT